MKEKVGGQRFYAFVMDSHMAVNTQVAAGRTVMDQYGEALRLNDVKSESTGHSFRLASDDVMAGCLDVGSVQTGGRDGLVGL